MRSLHRTHSRIQVPKGKMQDPLKGTHHKFMSTKMASASKLSKGKAIKHSVTGLSKLSPKATTPKKPKMSPPSYNEVMRECDVSTKQPLHVPVVPALRSPPPVSCVTNTTPPTDMANGPNTLTELSANITGAQWFQLQQWCRHVHP